MVGSGAIYDSLTNAIKIIVRIVNERENTKGANFSKVSQSTPAIREAGNAHRPTISWNAPNMLALYLGGDSSETNALCTGSAAAL